MSFPYLLASALRIAGSIQLFYFLFRFRHHLRKDHPSYRANRALAILVGCIVSYLLHVFAFRFDGISILRVPLILGAWASPVLIWIVAHHFFEDSFRIDWRHILALLITEIVSAWIFFTSPIPIHLWTAEVSFPTFLLRIVVPRLIVLLFSFLAIRIAWKGRLEDLIEERRQKRTKFIFLVSGLAILVVSNEVLSKALAPTQIPDIFTAGFILILSYLLTHESTAPYPFWELAAVTPPPKEPRAALDPETVSRLQHLLEHDRVFLSPDLTLARLAQKLGQPEYRLRKHINQTNGFRNFNEFLNQHRIGEAKARLSDPALRDLPIFNLSVELGYGSLISFHRAFRQATGMTPTEFRKGAIERHPKEESE